MTPPPPPFGSGILLGQLLVGGAASLVNLIIHALLLGAVVWTVRRVELKDTFFPAFMQYTVMIVSAGTLLVAGHFLEVVVWAITYALAGAAPAGSDLIYFAFGNYTTLGLGDISPVDGWRLLAPMTALNGIMLIGWSTALIVEVLRRTGHAA
ncbi:MAG TPA: potassium channel family protein, partial [Methyloceanibacter sp.]|nr:potassium channel family protein [Methyloceanibacter sp.]